MLIDKPLRGLLVACILALQAVAVSACNTFEGMGEDLQATGDWIENQFDEAE